MTDKNPYYSIPESLGKSPEELDVAPPSPELIEFIRAYHELMREFYMGLDYKGN